MAAVVPSAGKHSRHKPKSRLWDAKSATPFRRSQKSGCRGSKALGGGSVAPAETSSEAVGRVHAAVKAVEVLPDVREQVIRLGTVPGVSPPPDKLQDFIKIDIERWGKIIRQAGLAGSEG